VEPAFFLCGTVFRKSEKKERLRKIRVIEQVTLDGVIQAPRARRRRRLTLRRMGGAHHDPAAASRRCFRSSVGPSNLRYLERLLAQSPQKSHGGQPERGDEIRRNS
jgi:hypothetical protein